MPSEEDQVIKLSILKNVVEDRATGVEYLIEKYVP